jgi:hypothetical protein
VSDGLRLALQHAEEALSRVDVDSDDLKMISVSLNHYSSSLFVKGLATLYGEILDGDQTGALITATCLLLTAAQAEAGVLDPDSYYEQLRLF